MRTSDRHPSTIRQEIEARAQAGWTDWPGVERGGRPYPDLVRTVPHVAFEVDDLQAALAGHRVIIEPNSPSAGVTVAFIAVNGAPVELMQIDHDLRPDL